MHNEELLKKVGKECDDFLKTYSEDATARVSKEAFDRLLNLFCEEMVADHAACDARFKAIGQAPHSLTLPVYHNKCKDEFVHIVLNLRTREMVGTKVTRSEALKNLGGLPMEMNDIEKSVFSAMFLVIPKKVDLEDIEKFGVKPCELVSSIKKSAETIIFEEMSSKATQPAGNA